MDTSTPFGHLTPSQRWALYDHAKREAAELRRQAIRELGAQIAASLRAVWGAGQTAWQRLRSAPPPRHATSP
jgi:hypothetical protein